MDRVLCALIGLAGAVNNNGKTETTDTVIRRALLSEENEETVRLVHEEKYRVSPGCAACPSPCGNTSDYDIRRYENAPAEMRAIKDRIEAGIRRIAADAFEGEVLPEIMTEAIASLGYDLEIDYYDTLLEEMEKW